MRKLTGRHIAFLRRLAAAQGEWVLWQEIETPYPIVDALRTDGLIAGETWLTGYHVRITPAGRAALEEN